jgi:hypothetical protein
MSRSFMQERLLQMKSFRAFELPADIRNKLIWLFLLSPGFISLAVIGQIIDLGQLTEFQITYYSLVLTVVNLVMAIAVVWLVSIPIRLFSPDWNVKAGTLLFVSLIVGAAVGIAIGLAAEQDKFFLTVRSLSITKELNKRSSARPTTFLLSQNTGGQLQIEGDARPIKVTEAWAHVTLKGSSKTYEGWPEFYGVGKEQSEIYLSPACEISSKAGKQHVMKVPSPGVILYEPEILSIVLIERACSPCYLRWYPQKVSSDAQKACKG